MAMSRGPISVKEFIGAISKLVWDHGRYGMGLCVSGGPDSMALAALVSRVKAAKVFPLRVNAFVVDHHAREGSAREAETVASRLQDLGLSSEVLRIEWPNNYDAAKATDFETKARKERYRLLARAAIRHRLHGLYLGHHLDDQTETFLMRLIKPEKGRVPRSALLGMPSYSNYIPCCNDIFGACEGDSSTDYTDDGNVHLTHHGLGLIRPFLKFPKIRLQATCEEMGVPFFIDKTNFEPTRTRRNAFRHLITNHRLPRALQGTALLKVQDCLREKHSQSIDSYAALLWDRIRIRRFDIRSGLLMVQFPNHLDQVCKDLFVSAAYIVEDLIDAVSPASRGTISLSADTVDYVVKAIGLGTNTGGESSTNSAITAAGVLIEPIRGALRLSRQPLRMADHSKLTTPFVAGPQADSIEGQLWTEWIFWDNRFWIRIKLEPSEEASDYMVRAYTESDVVPTKHRLRSQSEEALRAFETALEAAAPSKTRFTLPVIIKQGQVIAFPTLKAIVPDKFGQLWHDTSLPRPPWQVRFKRQLNRIRKSCADGDLGPAD